MGSSHDTSLPLWQESSNAIAAYLKMSGFPVAEIKWDSEGCLWCFVDSKTLRQALASYQEGEALVDPKKYNRVFLETRSEMFASDPRPRPRVRQSSRR